MEVICPVREKKKRILEQINTVNKRLINIQELSELTGLSMSTLYSWVSQRRIPFVKCGRLTKFDLQKINDWIEESSVEENKFY